MGCRLFGGSDGIILCLIFWMSVMSVVQGGSFFFIATYCVNGSEVSGRWIYLLSGEDVLYLFADVWSFVSSVDVT